MSTVDVPAAARGAVTGAVFTTATLPITNYRFCKSMGIPVDFGGLYKAYLPTVLRDVVYGMCRQTMGAHLAKTFPELQKSARGRFTLTFFTVLASCLISAPGNEVRGYYLQPPSRRLPVREFFQPARFARSTVIGGLIMSTALGVGSLVTGPATEKFTAFKGFLEQHPLAKVLLGIFVAQQYFASSRHAQLMAKQDAIAAKKPEV